MLRVGIIRIPLVCRGSKTFMHTFMGALLYYQRRGCPICLCIFHGILRTKSSKQAEARHPAFLFVGIYNQITLILNLNLDVCRVLNCFSKYEKVYVSGSRNDYVAGRKGAK